MKNIPQLKEINDQICKEIFMGKKYSSGWTKARVDRRKVTGLNIELLEKAVDSGICQDIEKAKETIVNLKEQL